MIISIPVQKRINYRDVGSNEQVAALNEVFDDLGRIRTNERTFSYMDEIKSVYKILGFPKGRFVVIPNTAIIYSLLESPSPLPIDWMQGPEFVGSEDRLNEMMLTAFSGKEIFFLIDKYDSKRLADTLIPARFPANNYPYMLTLINSTQEYQIDLEWFDVRVTK